MKIWGEQRTVSRPRPMVPTNLVTATVDPGILWSTQELRWLGVLGCGFGRQPSRYAWPCVGAPLRSFNMVTCVCTVNRHRYVSIGPCAEIKTLSYALGWHFVPRQGCSSFPRIHVVRVRVPCTTGRHEGSFLFGKTARIGGVVLSTCIRYTGRGRCL